MTQRLGYLHSLTSGPVSMLKAFAPPISFMPNIKSLIKLCSGAVILCRCLRSRHLSVCFN